MLQKDNTVVIDVRNHYETVLGRFDGQTLKDVHGAEYVDPCMRKSTDFTSWLAKDETKELLQGKQVLMYCTGE
jgi:predicted sulfurtransferase